ncbi:hypothetical protein [Nocardioides sp. B-3]|uniref:hypothetical protein n=1 Tax=Nocardioides sp. B-3 TaxID=2895565 RepID=UPI002152CE6F|nr:hypothetical protein [Nocardioides sp. B-3]UUZ58162.1 hypothetical protein LP418_18055 [Nocardioides sp. B-3]
MTPDPAVEKPRNGYGLRLTTFNILSSSIARGGIDRATRAARWVQGPGSRRRGLPGRSRRTSCARCRR